MTSEHRGIRVLPRRSLQVEVTLTDCSLPGQICIDALNVSPSGIFLETELLLDEGEEFDLSFSLPGRDRVIVVRARVARVEQENRSGLSGWKPGMGLEFLDISEEDRDLLLGYIGRKEVREEVDRSEAAGM